ncbi:hypothetical protein BD626DRAFT_449235 [Schizophyllum amplum]|uniref:Uncharacterized protein n=1 Tax=Schizophyllum amplum TaxID=97359 RepID=A0A550D0P7_9AGAR|nr:hypothetical protein BD626DRAFT_449235 [Auriculariopsis ampla]
MSVPLRNSYVVVWIDPLETLEHLDDEEVRQACRSHDCGKYVAVITRGIGLPIPSFRYHTYKIDFLVQGLPRDEPDKHFMSAMSCPVLPNTSHPEGRRPVKPIAPLPWANCYHRARCRDTVKFRLRYSNDRPQSYLNIPEVMLLEQYLCEDLDRYETLRDCHASGTTPAPHEVSELTQLTIEAADEQYTERPEWEDIPANSEFEDEDGVPRNGDRLSQRDLVDGSEPSEDRESDDEGRPEDSEASAEDEPEDAQGDDFGAAVLAAMIGHEQDGGVLRMVLNVSYDLSLVDSPPDPTGYFKEMEAIAQIEEDFKQRMLRNIEEVKRQDEEYMASLAAKAPDVAKAELEPPVPSHVPLEQEVARKASVEHASADVDANGVACEKSTTTKITVPRTSPRTKAAGFAKTIRSTLKRAFTSCWPRRNAPRA